MVFLALQQSGSVSGRATYWAEFALAVGGFGIGTGEFASMGLLPNVATTYSVSVPQAGHVISAYALGVVAGAPIIAILGAKLPRRLLLLLLMAFFALGNVVSALAPSYGWLVALRFLSGFPHGAYFGVASLVAADMAAPDKRAQAVGRVMLGLTVATLLGTPLATWLGQSMGWRAAYVVVGAIGAATVGMILALVPIDPNKGEGEVGQGQGKRAGAQVWLTLGVAAVGFGGMFAMFSYITPTLVEVSHVPRAYVPLVLCVFGAGMVLGNIVGPRLADRALMPTIAGILVWDAIVLGMFYFTAGHAWLAVINVLLVGTGFALCPALQTRLMDVAGDAQTLAAALNHAAFNIANALGAWLAGLAITAGYGWNSTGWVGALFALGGLAIFVVSLLAEVVSQRTSTRPAVESAG
jgi:DHA1 family inner membrane transport protein